MLINAARKKKKETAHKDRYFWTWLAKQLNVLLEVQVEEDKKLGTYLTAKERGPFWSSTPSDVTLKEVL